MPIDLTKEEHELIVDLLKSYLPELKAEVHRARETDYKEGLKEREEIVVALQKKLDQS